MRRFWRKAGVGGGGLDEGDLVLPPVAPAVELVDHQQVEPLGRKLKGNHTRLRILSSPWMMPTLPSALSEAASASAWLMIGLRSVQRNSSCA